MNFCTFFREKRLARGTVRQFSEEYGFDPGYISRLENGVTLPPKSSAKLKRLAEALGLSQGSTEEREFLDLAAIAKNEIPEDLRNDKRFISILPAFYRTLRNEKLDEKEANRLLEMIKSVGKEETENESLYS